MMCVNMTHLSIIELVFISFVSLFGLRIILSGSR